ncbi:MAG: ZIP family metal transporter [Thermoanaerobaculia bacterium]
MAIALALLTFFSTLAGGLIGRRSGSRLHLFLGLAAGMLLGAALFDLLPEGLDLARDMNRPPIFVTGFAAAGFLFFHLLEKFLAVHSHPEPHYGEPGHSHVGDLGALAVTIHSFFDGAAIGVGFQVSNAAGFAVAGAVIAHDFSDGLNTAMLLKDSTDSRARAWLLADAAAPCLGALVTLVWRFPPGLLAPALGIFAGFFLYLGAAHLLPEAHRRKTGIPVLAATIGGFALLYAVSVLLVR